MGGSESVQIIEDPDSDPEHDVQCQQQESQPESHSAPLETDRGSGDWIFMEN